MADQPFPVGKQSGEPVSNAEQFAPDPAGRVCSISGCRAKHYARGWCEIHYGRWRRNGDPLVHLRPETTRTYEENFWIRVDADGDCWEWTGSLNNSGYGKVNNRTGGQYVTRSAHRVAYELLVGPIPDGLQIDHLCRNRRCVNPDHLEPVTAAENQRRGFAPVYSRLRAAAITSCPRGHAYDEANTYVSRSGTRNCRACRRPGPWVSVPTTPKES